jgi:hypothetical protein
MGAVMTQIVKVDFKGPKSFAPLAALDAFSNEAQAVVDMRTRIGKFLDAEPNTIDEAGKCIAALLALKPFEQHVTELTTGIADGLRPATPEQVLEQLALLIGAFPASNTPDPMVYSRMMLNEVIAAGPSVLALTAACSELRRTRQWPPPTADVLKTIREEEARWQYRFRCASEILGAHAKALEKLKKARAWLARPDEQKKAERQECLDRLERLRQQIGGAAAERSLV